MNFTLPSLKSLGWLTGGAAVTAGGGYEVNRQIEVKHRQEVTALKVIHKQELDDKDEKISKTEGERDQWISKHNTEKARGDRLNGEGKALLKKIADDNSNLPSPDYCSWNTMNSWWGRRVRRNYNFNGEWKVVEQEKRGCMKDGSWPTHY